MTLKGLWPPGVNEFIEYLRPMNLGGVYLFLKGHLFFGKSNNYEGSMDMSGKELENQ